MPATFEPAKAADSALDCAHLTNGVPAFHSVLIDLAQAVTLARSRMSSASDASANASNAL